MKQCISLNSRLFSGSLISSMVAAGVMSLSTDADAAGSWEAGDWTLSLGGNINAFYVYTACDDSDLGAGAATLAGLACAGALDKDGNAEDVSSVQNGLLPTSLNFKAEANQNGWDISANINVYYGIDSGTDDTDQPQADALKFSTVDARQVFLTFGKSELGTFKMGRDFGLFAYDAIINDMSLLGVGAGFVASDPGHTTLGGLGFGYVYTDRLAQINYSTPSFGGFQGTVGIFQGFDGVNATSASLPGFHAKVGYDWEAGIKGKVSATYLTQDVVTAAGTDEQITGWDLFANFTIADLGLLLYYFDAEGMSSLAIGGLIFPGFDVASGAPEEVQGYMTQISYSITEKLRAGVNYSSNEQDKVTKVENEKWTLGTYYNLTKSLTLVAEYSTQESDLQGTGTDETQNLTLGTFLLF